MKIELSKEQIDFLEECMKWSKYRIDNYDYTYGDYKNKVMYEYGIKRREEMATMINSIRNSFKEGNN